MLSIAQTYKEGSFEEALVWIDVCGVPDVGHACFVDLPSLLNKCMKRNQPNRASYERQADEREYQFLQTINSFSHFHFLPMHSVIAPSSSFH